MTSLPRAFRLSQPVWLSDSPAVSALKHEGAIWFPVEKLVIRQHYHYYKKHLGLRLGKYLSHLNMWNKQKATCQKGDIQNTNDKIPPSFPMIYKEIRLLRVKRPWGLHESVLLGLIGCLFCLHVELTSGTINTISAINNTKICVYFTNSICILPLILENIYK